MKPSDHFKILTFVHANMNRPLNIVAGSLLGFIWSETTKSVNLYTTGGIMFPVKESEEQIKQMINSLQGTERTADGSATN